MPLTPAFTVPDGDAQAHPTFDGDLPACLGEIDDHFVCYDAQWRYTFVSQGAARVLARSKEEVLGRSIWELFPDAVGNQYYLDLHKAAAEHCTVRSEHYYAPFERWFENHIYPVTGGVAVLAVDITDRKRAEIKANEASEAQRLLLGLQEAVAEIQDPAQVLWKTLAALGRHLQASRCVYAEVDEANQVISASRDYTHEVDSVEGLHRVSDLDPAFATCLITDEVLAIADTRQDKLTNLPRTLATLDRLSIVALISVPLVKDGVVIATLSVHNKSPRAWLPREIALVEQVAQQVWFAVDAARTQIALAESRGVLSFAMRGGRMGAWSRNVETNKVWWSRELEEVFGLEPGGFGGMRRDFQQFVHEDDRQALTQAVQAALETHTDYSVEFRFRHANGSLRWMEGRGRALYDTLGRPTMLYGLGIDITERRAAGEVLRRQAAIFEHQTDAVIVTDVDGRIVDMNPAGERMYGYRLADLVGQPVSILHAPEEADHLMAEALESVRAQGEWKVEIDFIRKGGTRGVSETVVKPLLDGSGKLLGTVGVNRDVSDRRRAEDDLRRINEALSAADRRKDEFIATLAHELRNPLSPIRNALGILQIKTAAQDQRQWAIDVLDRQVQQMTRLVDDLLEVSRITQGKLELRKEPLDLATVMKAAAESAHPQIQAAGHAFALAPPSTALQVEGDPLRLTQIILNLLNNAAKYTRRGGHVSLSAEREGDHAVLRVKDTGVGMEAKHLPLIFNMFAQVVPALQRSHGGLGIGLALVRGLVELHDGSVEARSKGLGFGSEFVVRLPLSSMPASQAPRHTLPAELNTPAQKVLVVDDNEDAAESMMVMLQLFGHDVRRVADGEAAVAEAFAFRPQTVLLDIGLPKLNGYQVAQAIRAQAWGQAMRLIALTGWGQDADRMRAFDAGFDLHLTKPIEIAELETALTTPLRRRTGA